MTGCSATEQSYWGGWSSGGAGGRALEGHRGGDDLGLAQLGERLALDLADALGREPHGPAGLPQRERLAVAEPVPEGQDLALLVGQQRVHGLADLPADHALLDLVEPGLGLRLLDQLAELGVLADGRLEGDRLAPLQLEQVLDLLGRGSDGLCHLLRAGFLAGPLGHVPGGRLDLADPLADVDRQPDRPPPVGDGPGDGLPDPPRGVRGELESPAPVEQLDGAHQAEIAVLDQVEQREALALVLPGHRNHQPEVRQDEPLAGLAGLPDLLLGLPDAAGGPQVAGPRSRRKAKDSRTTASGSLPGIPSSSRYPGGTVTR